MENKIYINNKNRQIYMNKNILLFIFGVIFLIGMTTASLPSLGTFKQNENIRIAQICSDATFIIISSITFPNSSIAVSSTNMTSAGNGEFFYMFNITSSLGRYDLRGVSDGCEETFATYFEVTESGDTFSLSQALILLWSGLSTNFKASLAHHTANNRQSLSVIYSGLQSSQIMSAFSCTLSRYSLIKLGIVSEYVLGIPISIGS